MLQYYVRKGWVISGLEQGFFLFFFPLEDKIHFLLIPISLSKRGQTWLAKALYAEMQPWMPGSSSVVRNPVSKSKMKKWLRKTPGSDLASIHIGTGSRPHMYAHGQEHIHAAHTDTMAVGSAALSSPLPQAPLPAPGSQGANYIRAEALLSIY